MLYELFYGNALSLLLAIISIGIVIWAQAKVQGAYSKYSKVRSLKGYTGYDVARTILDNNGLNNVKIVETRGKLTDHYDPRGKVVRLSSGIYHGNSIASLSVAAHEVGHAIQDKENYRFMRIRHNIIPFANLGSQLGWASIMIGLLFGGTDLVYFGVILLLGMVAFQLVTLPVEFNASWRASVQLKQLNLIYMEESDKVKSMLNAAALTYVAALISSILQILRLLIYAGNRRD